MKGILCLRTCKKWCRRYNVIISSMLTQPGTSALLNKPAPYEYKSFKFDLVHKPSKTLIKIQFLTTFFNTRQIPSLYDYLEKNYPQVLETLCFNSQNLPFSEEVRGTEFGHLFEHLLISKIYDIKKQGGDKNFIVQGRTHWDWTNETRGSFNIYILISDEDRSILNRAISETVIIMEDIIGSGQNNSSTGNPLQLPVDHPICT